MKIKLSGNLKRFAGFNSLVDIDAATVREAITRLVAQYPELGPVLLDHDASVRVVHRLFLDGDQLEQDQLDKSVDARAELGILTALAGG